MVSSTVLILACSTSSESLSRAAIILSGCPSIRCETVFRRTLGPANSTFTSGMAGALEVTAPNSIHALWIVFSGERDDSFVGTVIVLGT